MTGTKGLRELVVDEGLVTPGTAVDYFLCGMEAGQRVLAGAGTVVRETRALVLGVMGVPDVGDLPMSVREKKFD